MIATTFTVTGDAAWSAYLTLHVLYGLVTHYHSVIQVKRYNKLGGKQVNATTVCLAFVLRMVVGLPCFIIKSIVAPTGNAWHMTPEELQGW